MDPENHWLVQENGLSECRSQVPYGSMLVFGSAASAMSQMIPKPSSAQKTDDCGSGEPK